MENPNTDVALDKMLKSITKYADKRDAYDEFSGLKVAKKVKFAIQGAKSLNLDANNVAQIIIGEGMSHLAYGKLGEDYLKRVDRDFSMEEYTRRLIGAILYNENKTNTEEVISAVNRYKTDDDRSASEKFAFMMMKGFDYADSIRQKDYRDICYINYKNKILKLSAEAKSLTGPIIPDNRNPRPKTMNVNRKRALMRINYAQSYFKSHISLIPEEIRRAFGDLGEDKLSAYYAVSVSERVLEKLYKQQDKDIER